MTRRSRTPRALARLFALAITATLAACAGPPPDGSNPTAPEAPLVGEPLPDGPEQPAVLRRYVLPQNPQITVPVLRADVFRKRYAGTPELPRTHAEIIALAKQVYLQPGTLDEGGCGEHHEGLVLGALSNPAVSDRTRREVDAILLAGSPALPRTYSEGRFRFFYTDSDPNPAHNVTLAGIKATAKVFNAAWDAYLPLFGAPKHYLKSGQPTVDVQVYYQSGRYGSTSSFSKAIFINSKTVVNNYCKRESTPAHELFHRVQYAHGYVSGQSDLKWAVEGTAVWSQKFRAPHIGDWMLRINTGLYYAYRGLFDRSYDAAHLWIHLGRWAGDDRAVIRSLWRNFQRRVGHDRQPMVQALDEVIDEQVGRDLDHVWLMERWTEANLLKEFSGVAATQTYDEQHLALRCGTSAYGPVRPVRKRMEVSLPNPCGGALQETVRSLKWYGADYYVVEAKPGTGRVEVSFEGKDPVFTVAMAEVDPGGRLLSLNRSARLQKRFTFSREVTGNTPLRLGFVVTAAGSGGSYTARFGAPGPDKCQALADACNEGICSKNACAKLPRPDGTPCDDKNPATTIDTCQKGVCSGK